MQNIYNIPPSQPFADALARGIIKKYGQGPFALADITLLLPNRRSIRSVQEAFLRASHGKAMLLPKMQPLGDVGDEDFAFRISLGGIDAQLPPVLSSTKQRLLLSGLVEKFQGGYIGRSKITAVQSTNLAIELAEFLNEVQRQQLPFDKLRSIVPEELATHWQITLDFMDIIIRMWPEILAEKNVIDPGTYRNLALANLAGYWQQNPPANPVIAAGSTGSIPAVAHLLKVIAAMPAGAVVLPGLDQIMDDESWEAISETHPQFGLKNLLGSIGVARSQLMEWPGMAPVKQEEEQRAYLISEIMRPAQTSEMWQKISSLQDDAVHGITRIDAPTMQDEARVIAMIFRETLETKNKTAALITGDQNLAARVTGIMARWNIELDNSSGMPLADVPPCVFMRLIARMAEEKIAPVPLLACLKHPMAQAGGDAGSFKANIREVERLILRGLRRDGGIAGMISELEENNKEELAGWLGNIENILQPFIRLSQQGRGNFKEMVLAHIETAEALAATAHLSGAENLWGHDDGTSLKEFFDELLEAADVMPEIQPIQYNGILEALLQGKTYRPKYGSHPRLAVLSPMEARMQRFDVVILGGLNEGSWPPAPEAGPWMSRPMRKTFGLPLPERQIGQAAHDFTQLLHAGNVVLTRSEKVDGTSTIASRWLMRMDAVLGICGKQHLLKPQLPWVQWAQELDRLGTATPCRAPRPTPPLSARRKKNAEHMELSVTQVETLMRDPYSYYAAKILNLKKLDPIDMEAGGRELGDIIHKVIEKFVVNYDRVPPAGRLDFLHDTWLKLLKDQHIPLAVQAFWKPRFKNIAEELIVKEQQRRKHLRQVLGEVQGAYTITLQSGSQFKVTARADRLEISHDDHITIIDYKTKSQIQSIKADILNGTLPQMPLEALIAGNAGFKDVQGQVADMEYWFITGGNDSKDAINEMQIGGKFSKDGGLGALLGITKDGLHLLAETFSNQDTPYLSCPDPEKEPEYNDFEHLARRTEW